MLTNLEGLGAQTINKIAEMALASQMKRVEQLSVDVSIHPQSLSKGIVNSLRMEGRKLVTPSNLQADHISFSFNDVGVYPFKALLGNIQLTKPAIGEAAITLKEADILETLQVLIAQDKSSKLSIKLLSCTIKQPNIIQFRFLDSQGEQQITLRLLYEARYQEVVCELVQNPDHELAQLYEDHLLQRMLTKILNFQFLIFDGIAFTVKSVQVTDAQLKLEAIAKISSFPKAKSAR